MVNFDFGVASGDPLSDRVIIWTHAKYQNLSDAVPLSWQVATDLEFTKIISSIWYGVAKDCLMGSQPPQSFCEMMTNYALEGLIAHVLQSPAADAAWLRANVEFLIVPFVDKDGVEHGDQGKNRQPRDHGRDYAGASLHPACAALRDLLPVWSAGMLRVVLDLHCPWIRAYRPG